MLANLLYFLFPYQIFSSITFRAGMSYLTIYLFINLLLPRVIHVFRRKNITSDFTHKHTFDPNVPYQGATPIMGGIILIPCIILSTLLWANMNVYLYMAFAFMITFGLLGFWDDFSKVKHKRKIEEGKAIKPSYADKADGASGLARLILEFIFTFLILGIAFYFFIKPDTKLYFPGVPVKYNFISLPLWLFLIFSVFVVVGGANSINLTDGLDSLVSVPLITSAIFIAIAAYVGADAALTTRLKLPALPVGIKEVSIFAISIAAVCLNFLRFNSPPASIYMGDIGALGIGASLCSLFIFVKAELYMPIIGASFVIAAISVIIQRLYFKLMQSLYGREYAKTHRFFYRAPYHHHEQALLAYTTGKPVIHSLWHKIVKKFGFGKHVQDQYTDQQSINNKTIWRNHLRNIFLITLAFIIYFKVR